LSSVKISLQVEPAYRKMVERRKLRAAARQALQHQMVALLQEDVFYQDASNSPRGLASAKKSNSKLGALRAFAVQSKGLLGKSVVDGRVALELAIVITGDDQIQALNRQYRQVDAPTDVLAFAATEASGAFVEAPAEALYLGDIVISYPRAEAQAQAGGHPTSAELQLLVVHGVLHLLGYEHATAAQKRTMWAAQAEIMQAIGAPITGPA
jgi:probable rRNA maturation factor